MNMRIRVVQISFAAVLIAAYAAAAAAAQPQEERHATVAFVDKKPPKYEYGYIVSDKEGNAQGHVESRDGVYALGRYYVNSPNGSGQKVTYFADDLGYHPLVSYASTSSKGSTRTQFAMGEKAIAALHDNLSETKVGVLSTPTFTSASLAAVVQQPNVLLVPPTDPARIPTTLDNVIPTYETKFSTTDNPTKETLTGKQTILHIPGLRSALKSVANNANDSQVVNLTAEVGAIGSDKTQEIVRLSSYLQPPDNVSSGYNTDFQAVQEQLTEEQRQNLYLPSEVYLTTTMKPIVVSSTPKNSIATDVNGQSGYQSVDNSLKVSDSATQSSNSIVDQLAPLQAGISILSSEGAKPIEESIQSEPIRYKTVVDIQEGISVDVRQDTDGNLHLASNFGDKISTTQPTPIRGLGYERRLVNPIAQEIVKDPNPISREQKEAEFLARQEAEVLAVQKSIEELQQQIISQIDAEHAEQEKKQTKSDQKVESVDAQDQNSIQSSNTPVQVPPSQQVEQPQFETPDEQQTLVSPVVPVSYPEVDRHSFGNNQIEILPRTVKSQNLAGILTLNPAPHAPQEDTPDLVPPPLTDENQPVLLEPYPIEEEVKPLPAPAPTLFPVKVETPVIVEKPTLVETTKVVEKPVVVKEPVEYTKVLEVEKPVPVLQPYPVEVTKVVHVDRPVPVPHPVAVSHPVPVPVAVPHPIEVPVPVHHLIPVPEIFPIALKEYYPVYIHKTKSHPKPEKLFTPESGELFKPEFAKKPEFRLRPDFGYQHEGDLQFSGDALKQALENFRGGDSFHGHRGHYRNQNALRNLRIEYGFKPPLRPSVEITEEVKPSIYGPSVRAD